MAGGFRVPGLPNPPPGDDRPRSSPMPNGPGGMEEEEEIELSLRDYYDIILRYRRIVVLVSSFCFISAIGLHFFLPKKFNATAKLVNSESVASSRNPLFSAMMPKSGVDLNTLIEVGRSTRVLTRSMDEVHLEMKNFEEQGFKTSREEQMLLDKLDIDFIRNSIQMVADSGTEDVILLRTQLKSSPHLSAAVSNAVAKALLDSLTESRKSQYNKQLEQIEEALQNNDQEILKIENELKLLLDPGEGISLSNTDERISRLIDMTEQRLNDAILEKEQVTDQIQALRVKFGVQDVPMDQVVWQDTSSGLFQTLRTLRFQREELLTRYRPENPSIRKLNDKIRSLELTLRPEEGDERIFIEVDRFAMSEVSQLLQLQSKSKAMEKKVEFIRGELEAHSEKLLESPMEQKRVRELNQKLSLLEKIYLDYHRSQHKTKMLLLATNSVFEIMELAVPSEHSTSPGLVKFAAIGLTLGLGMGCALAFVLNNWDNTLKSTIDVKRNFKIPALGAVPRWEEDEKYIDEMMPDASIAEVYGVLRNNVRFSNFSHPEKRLLICSPLQNEGKSITAINLGLSFALEGAAVCLISADLRRPFSHTRFRRKEDMRKTKGIVEYLLNKVEMEDVLFESNFGNFHFIPTCARAANPAKLLKGERFKLLLDEAEKRFDVVIIDSPAILPVVDASIIAPLMRGTLFVASANQTSVPAITEAISRLDHVGSPIMGICLNKIRDLRMELFYGSGKSYYDHAYKT